MMKLLPMLILIFALAVPASALEVQAPAVPKAGEELMPEDTSSFSDALISLLQKAVLKIRPDLAEASAVSLSLICAGMLLTILSSFADGKNAAQIAGAVSISGILLRNANSMIRLAADTVQQLSDYGKLLFPVMTTALAAQGGMTASTGLYLGTAFFSALLSSLLSGIFVPAIWLFLALAVSGAAISEDMLKKIRDSVKSALSWSLKTVLTVFTTYMSITGVVSGTTDAAALKAAKVGFSSFVPVVGGILSDASEAVLVGAGIMKNAAGIYGILAVLSLFLGPFLRIGAHYLILKVTALVCGVFGTKSTTGLIEDFSAAMGLLLGMVGSVCLLLLIAAVCFMKGVNG